MKVLIKMDRGVFKIRKATLSDMATPDLRLLTISDEWGQRLLDNQEIVDNHLAALKTLFFSENV